MFIFCIESEVRCVVFSCFSRASAAVSAVSASRLLQPMSLGITPIGSIAIGVTNLGPDLRDVIVPLSALGWADAGTTVSVRDLWALKDLGTSTMVVNVTVPSHDTAVLKLRKA